MGPVEIGAFSSPGREKGTIIPLQEERRTMEKLKLCSMLSSGNFNATVVWLLLQVCVQLACGHSNSELLSTFAKSPFPRTTKAFSTATIPQTYKLGCVTWNMAERSPSFRDMSFIRSLRNRDLVVIGVQVIPLSLWTIIYLNCD